MFKQDRLWEHNQQAKAVLSKISTDTLIIAIAVAYLLLSPLLNLYDWRLGIASVVTIALAASALFIHYKEYHRIKLARKCPVCGGLLDVDEKIIRGQTTHGTDGFAPIVDRVSTCVDCGRQHHHVYADWNQAGSVIPTSLSSAYGDITNSMKTIMQKRYPGKSDEEIDQLVAEYAARGKPKQTSREEWEAILKQLQEEAAEKNRQSGMVFPEHQKTR